MLGIWLAPPAEPATLDLKVVESKPHAGHGDYLI